MRPIYTAIALRCRWNCTKNSINFVICSCNSSTYIVQKVRFEAFMWINLERLCKEACLWISDCLTHALQFVLKQSGERLHESVLFTCEMEQFPGMMMLFQSLPAFWWTCGTENTEISVKCESYFSTWLNWSCGGFCAQSIHLMGLLLLAVLKSTTNIYSVHCMWKSVLDFTSKCL